MYSIDQLKKLPTRLAQWSAEFFALESIFPGVEVLYIAAICDRESGGNRLIVSPDGGHGLMQIDDRYHPTFIAAKAPNGLPLWTMAIENLLYGSLLLIDNLTSANRHAPIDSDALVCAIAGYNADLQRVFGHGAGLTGQDLINAVDAITTGGNYVSDVFRRRQQFLNTISAAD